MIPFAHPPHFRSFLAAAAEAPAISFTDALLLLAVAALVVVTYQLHNVVRRLTALEARLRASPAPVQAAAVSARSDSMPGESLPVETGAPSPEIRAALAAAVYAMLGRSARIVAVTDGAETSQVWSLEGRRQIFASHQIR